MSVINFLFHKGCYIYCKQFLCHILVTSIIFNSCNLWYLCIFRCGRALLIQSRVCQIAGLTPFGATSSPQNGHLTSQQISSCPLCIQFLCIKLHQPTNHSWDHLLEYASTAILCCSNKLVSVCYMCVTGEILHKKKVYILFSSILKIL